MGGTGDILVDPSRALATPDLALKAFLDSIGSSRPPTAFERNQLTGRLVHFTFRIGSQKRVISEVINAGSGWIPSRYAYCFSGYEAIAR